MQAGPSTLPVPSQSRPTPARPQPYPFQSSQAGPSSSRLGASPMTGAGGTSFNGGMSIDKSMSFGGGKSFRMSGGGAPGSYGARFYGVPQDSPSYFATSVNMDGGGPGSFIASSAAFGLPAGSMSSSYRRSYAAAARGDREMNPNNLSSSFASMSFQPMSMSMGGMSFGNSYSKSQVHSLMANRPRTDAEITKTYECCGQTHKGLHELLEHVEDAHPFADGDPSLTPGMNAGGMQIDSTAPSTVANGLNGPQTHPHQQIGFSPQVLAMDLELEQEQPDLSALGTIEERPSAPGSQRSSMSPITAPALPSYPVPNSGSGSKPATPNESGTPGGSGSSPAPLQISDILTSPFTDSLLSSSNHAARAAAGLGGSGPGTAPGSRASTSSSPPDGTIATPTTSQQPSPVFAVPKVGPARVGGFLGSVARPSQGRFDRAFNEVVAGNQDLKGDKDNKQPTAVAPGMLFASAVAGLGIPTAPPVPGQKQEGTANAAGIPAAGEASNEEDANKTPNLNNGGSDQFMPQPSLFTTHKPWRCPNPGCNKAYKQSNGLKYHQQKGQCDFAIHDAVDLGLSIEEAEERSRPFVCAVGAGCLKRYRQMNGLKYHYLNSGEHGKYGLRMLQNGTHPQPSGIPALTKKPTPSSATSSPTTTPSRPAGAPYQIPSQLGQTRPIGQLSSNGSGSGATGTVNANGQGQAPGSTGHPLPRMGVFPTTTRPPGSGAPGTPGTNGTNNATGAVRAGSTIPPRPNVPGSATAFNGQRPPAPASQVRPGAPGNGGLQSPIAGRQQQQQHQQQQQIRNPLQQQQQQQQQRQNQPPIQRGRDAVLFAAVETMDL